MWCGVEGPGPSLDISAQDRRPLGSDGDFERNGDAAGCRRVSGGRRCPIHTGPHGRHHGRGE